eukprot:CAMPEP_0115282066 /NCGR_PEP_ID=MMETSP0270-20121206/59647_1 /TAXON_ID=71861 /ORGANISM="Scrippsiella trochoidea, Strain CCMP3099" /LENGTH=244 /DNA_ID=CAMNT_0002698893 /DNA_START=66 /DNA_END=800 /DNA_ORIENTATION=+
MTASPPAAARRVARRRGGALATLLSLAAASAALAAVAPWSFCGGAVAGAHRRAVIRRADLVEVPGDIKTGMTIIIDGEPQTILSHKSKRMGKGVGKTMMQTRNILTGVYKDHTLGSGKKFEKIDPYFVKGTFSYTDEETNSLVFFDEEFEQLSLDIALAGEGGRWLTEGARVKLDMYNEKPYKFSFSEEPEMEVISIDDSGRSDGAITVELANGEKMQGPGFLKVGDIVTLHKTTFKITGRKKD